MILKMQLQLFGGSGNSSASSRKKASGGASMSNSEWTQNMRNEANQLLRDNGYTRYDNIPYVEASKTSINAYYKLEADIDNGITPKINYTQKTKDEMIKLTERAKLMNAKRIVGEEFGDDDGYSTIKSLVNNNKTYDKMLSILKSKNTQSKTKTTNSRLDELIQNGLKAGWSLEEATQKAKNALNYAQNYIGKYEGREITSSTYKRAVKRTTKQSTNWLTGRVK